MLLDLDGTLVDSRAAFASCLRGALDAAGVEAPPDEVLHTFLGPPIEETLEVLGVREVLAVRDDYRRRYREEGVGLTTVFDGVPAMLDALADRPLALCTSKPEPIARAVLGATGLLDRFTVVGAADPEAIAEPKTTTMARVLEALGTREGTMVGDRRHDIEAARAHALRVIGVMWWDNPHEDELAAADAIARSTAELPSLV